MFFVLFIIVGSRLVGEELPLFVALFGKLCMYYSTVLQVSIFRLVITARLRRSVSSILSLSVGHLSVFTFPCKWQLFGRAWWCFLVFYLCNGSRLPPYFYYFCVISNVIFYFSLFVAFFCALFLLCLRVNRLICLFFCVMWGWRSVT